MAVAGKWLGRAVTALMILLIVVMAFFIITSRLNGGKTAFFGYELMTVLSGSMEPGIQTGSLIAVKPLTTNGEKAALKVGDVVTYQALDNPNVLITHRIVEMKEIDSTTQLITKGDNNDANDISPVPVKNVIAKYSGITLPYLGYFLSFAQSKMGTIILIIVPGAMLILSQFVGVWKIMMRKEEEKEKKPLQEN
ncbi:signal peptidase I SipW [Thermicanus aegyptius]|uniref:signal peptidase I SipW n=1 Tax=Thermicanus aegyptius TaxID=94009 RepID=UPI0003F90456|nr:signal peptidase I [Thermicanus aegyptius]